MSALKTDVSNYLLIPPVEFEEFTEKVNEAFKEGYELYGNVIIRTWGGTVFYSREMILLNNESERGK